MAGMLFAEIIEKYNDKHDKLGRFASKDGGGAVSGKTLDIKSIKDRESADRGVSSSDGSPKTVIVYHGSNSKFDEFNNDSVGDKNRVDAYGEGFYFADTPEQARLYGDNVYAVELSYSTDRRTAKKTGRTQDYQYDKETGIWTIPYEAQGNAKILGVADGSTAESLEAGFVVTKTFDEIIEKFNPYHGKDGRFAAAPGGGAAAAGGPTKDSSGNALSPGQAEYFKDSVVKDADGNLMVMYHGTPNAGEIEVFDGDKLNNSSISSQIGQGFYFTNVKAEAEAYLVNSDIYGNTKSGTNPHLHETYLDIRKPFDVGRDTMDLDKAKQVYEQGDYDWFFSSGLPHQLANKSVNGKSYTKSELQAMDRKQQVSLYVDYLYKDGGSAGNKAVLSNMVRAYKYGNQSELLRSMEKNMGIDGIMEEFRPGQFQFAAFSSSQIKSVKNTNPTRTDDINKAGWTVDEVIEKFNPYHGKDGRFTTGPGGGAGAWAASLEQEKAQVLAMEPSEQALYVLDHDGESYDNCVAAMKNGTTEALVNNYFAIMGVNGDPTPTKETSGQMGGDLKKDVDSGKYSGYEEARKAYVQDMTGQTEAEAEATMKSMKAYFGAGKTSHPERLDQYIEDDHAYDGKIYRGMHFDNADYDAFMANVSPGASIRMNGNSSWSSSEEVAAGFAHRGANETNSIMITCVRNRTSAPVDHLSTWGESEVMAHSQASWTVLHVETVEWSSGVHKTHITVVESGDYGNT